MNRTLANLMHRLEPAYRLYNGCAISLLSRYPIGTNVFDREWDLLVLLDTCRVDALREVAPEYDFLDDVGSLLSVGSSSSEWIAQTFNQNRLDEIGNTAYVSANAWAKRVIEDRTTPEEHADSMVSWTDWNVAQPKDFLLLEQAWQTAPETNYEIEAGGAPPEYLADRAIAAGREHEPDRLVVHFMQPHRPYTANAVAEGRPLEPHEEDPWKYLRSGGDLDCVWESYLDHLRYALDSVEVLLNNVDAERAVISADHGDAFGEFGLYAHGVGLPHPHVKRVPWAVTSAEDTGEYEVGTVEAGESSRSAEEHLEALGYL